MLSDLTAFSCCYFREVAFGQIPCTAPGGVGGGVAGTHTTQGKLEVCGAGVRQNG